MTKVYVLWESEEYEPSRIVGIYVSKIGAHHARAALVAAQDEMARHGNDNERHRYFLYVSNYDLMEDAAAPRALG